MDDMKKMSAERLVVLSLEKYAVSCRLGVSKEVFDFAQTCKSELLRRLDKYERLKKFYDETPHDKTCTRHVQEVKYQREGMCDCRKKEITP